VPSSVASGADSRLGEPLSPPAVLDRVVHYAKLARLVYRDYVAHSLRVAAGPLDTIFTNINGAQVPAHGRLGLCGNEL
jgi:hypothetical protein